MCAKLSFCVSLLVIGHWLFFLAERPGATRVSGKEKCKTKNGK
jgi:hypothetical protein